MSIYRFIGKNGYDFSIDLPNNLHIDLNSERIPIKDNNDKTVGFINIQELIFLQKIFVKKEEMKDG